MFIAVLIKCLVLVLTISSDFTILPLYIKKPSQISIWGGFFLILYWIRKNTVQAGSYGWHGWWNCRSWCASHADIQRLPACSGLRSRIRWLRNTVRSGRYLAGRWDNRLQSKGGTCCKCLKGIPLEKCYIVDLHTSPAWAMPAFCLPFRDWGQYRRSDYWCHSGIARYLYHSWFVRMPAIFYRG